MRTEKDRYMSENITCFFTRNLFTFSCVSRTKFKNIPRAKNILQRDMKESQSGPGVEWLYFRVLLLCATFLLTSDLTTHIAELVRIAIFLNLQYSCNLVVYLVTLLFHYREQLLGQQASPKQPNTISCAGACTELAGSCCCQCCSHMWEEQGLRHPRPAHRAAKLLFADPVHAISGGFVP